MKTKKIFLAVITIIVIVLFYWPGIYRYETLKLGENFYTVRINRLTGVNLLFQWPVDVTDKSNT